MVGKAGIALLALCAVFALAASAGADSKRGNFRACGKVDLEYTKGELKARGMKCGAAKHLFNQWAHKVDCDGGGNGCERVEVGKFTCLFGGTERRLHVKCTHDTRPKAMRATWGG